MCVGALFTGIGGVLTVSVLISGLLKNKFMNDEYWGTLVSIYFDRVP